MSNGTLDEKGYIYYEIKHSAHFVDPSTGYHKILLRICDATAHLPKIVFFVGI